MSAQRAAQLLEAGLWLQMSGDVEGARRLFEQALKLDPANGRARELLETMQASVRAAPEAMVAPLPELARIATPPKVPAVDPFRAPDAPERSSLFDFDWSKATGLERPPATQEPERAREAESESESNSDASLRSVPPAMKPADPLRWESLAEPMPPPEDVDVPIELPSPVEEPPGKPVVRPVRFAPNATSAWDSQSNPGVHLQDVNRAMGDAMDLVDDPPAAKAPEPESPAQEAPAQDGVRQEVETLLQGARDLLELDDHSGAMELIVKAQQLAPNDPDVQAMRERSEKTLQTMFESKLGEMTSRPRVVLKDDEIIWLNLDHRAGFVLAQIDGTVSFEDLFEVCGMSRLDTARILAQLMEEGVITT